MHNKKITKKTVWNIVKWILASPVIFLGLTSVMRVVLGLPPTPGNLIAALVTIILSTFVAVAVHELGHVLAGKLCNYKCYEIQILCLKVSFYRDRVSFGWSDLSLLGGCLSVPTRVPNLKQEFIQCIAGPAASLVLCVGMLLLMRASGSSLLGLAFMIMSIVVLLNIIPIFWETGFTDMARAINCLRKDIHAILEMRLLYLYHLDQQSTRPRDMPADLLCLDVSKARAAYRMMHLQICMYYRLDALEEGPSVEGSSIKAIGNLIEENCEFLFSQKSGLYLVYLMTVHNEEGAHAYYEKHSKSFAEATDINDPEFLFLGRSVYEKAYRNRQLDESVWRKVLDENDASGIQEFLERFFYKWLFKDAV